ncbi:uncharacterized protein LOC121878787 isoform X2 [Homarus americanus]|nr:uncharacterized protein LOC121878787 isoform X2 [Homarus americanus]XP_042241138.1 uncharacterized protein LOC121878787 isoform X2 [Homarus americanus]
MTSPACFRLQSCMGCIPLQRGTIIIGFLALFGSLIEIFKCILLMVDVELSMKQCQLRASMERNKHSSDDGDDDDHLMLRSDDDDDDDHDHVSKNCSSGPEIHIFRFAMSLRMVMSFVYFILTALMILGAKKGNPRLMAPWLWWQLAQITFFIIAVFGHFANFDNIFYVISIVILVIYFFLVVNSYYLQLLESTIHTADLRVVAVAHPRMGMTLTIPSPRKDDLPPPYPGFAPDYNTGFNPNYVTGVIDGAQYIPGQNIYPSQPPPYSSNNPYQSGQVGQPIPQNQELHANVSVVNNPPPNSGGEAAPLVEKNPLPQN